MCVPVGVASVVGSGMEHIFMVGMLLQVHILVVIGIRKAWCLVTGFLIKDRACMVLRFSTLIQSKKSPKSSPAGGELDPGRRQDRLGPVAGQSMWPIGACGS